MSAISLQNVTRRFGHLTALQNINLEILNGQTFALFGPNGAGKTTLLRLIATLAKPSSGDISVHDLQDPEQIRQHIGFISHQTLLYDDLTGRENLAFYGQMYGLENYEIRIDEVLLAVGLQDRQRDRIRNFSRGMKQRLTIARAILHKPSILLLDEPFTGLDPSAQTMLSSMFVDLKAEGRTIFLVTHNLAHGLALADRFGILFRGKLIHESPTENIDLSQLQTLYEQSIGQEHS